MSSSKTTPKVLKHLENLSIDDDDSAKFLKPRAPALKAAFRVSRTPTTTTSPSSLAASANRSVTTLGSPTPVNSDSILSTKWFDDLETTNASSLAGGNVDGRLWRNVAALTPSPPTDQYAAKEYRAPFLSPNHQDYSYDQTLLPAFLFCPGMRTDCNEFLDETGGVGDGGGGAVGVKNLWKDSTPTQPKRSPPSSTKLDFASPFNLDSTGDDLFENEDDGRDRIAVQQAPWKNTSNMPPPPPRVGKINYSSPVKLERLGPLRASSSSRRSDDYVPEPPRLPYVAVANHGPRPDTPRPKVPPGFTNPRAFRFKHVSGVRQEKSDYEKLIRDAASKKDAALAEEYLQQMITDYYAGVSSHAPDGMCYNLVLHAYSCKGDAEQAEAVLKLMWEDYERGNEKALPNQRVYTSVQYAWQKSRNKYYAPERCEKLLVDMYHLYESGKAPNCKPDLFAFTCCLHCWADSNRKDAVARATALFRDMMSRCERGESDLLPDNVAYSNLVNCYVNANSSKNFSMIEKAENLFWEMVDSFHNGNKKAAPSTRNFNTIMAAYSKSNSKQAAEHAHKIILRWEKLVESGDVIEKPDAFSYSLWLKCWANSHHQDAMEMLESTVQHLRDVASTANSAARLDSIKYTTIIQAFARNNKVQKAHDLLMEMASVYQNNSKWDRKCEVKLFSVVLGAWSRFSNGNIAAEQATALIEKLWCLYKYDSRVKPNLQSYNFLLICFKNARQPRRAQSVLDEMKDYAAAKFMDHPNANSYGTVLDAWYRSKDPCKNVKINLLMKECMDRFGSVPVSSM